MCSVRYKKVHNRVVAIQELQEGICMQEVGRDGETKNELGEYFCYPYESWMDYLINSPTKEKIHN